MKLLEWFLACGGGITSPWTLSLSGGVRLGQFLNPTSAKFECPSPKSLRRITFSHMSDAQQGVPGGSAGKESACNVEDLGLIPGSGRSPGEGNGNPIQSS